MNPRATLDDLVGAIVDGVDPDWTEVESQELGNHEKKFIQGLRIVAGVSAVHRTHSAPDPLDDAAGDLSLAAEASAPLGRLAHFDLLEVIGEGTFGKVFRARDTRLGRTVALKVLKPEVSSQAALVKRMLHEARALAAISDPHVVTVFEADVYDGCAGLCMEYIKGQTLEELLARQGRFSAEEANLVGQHVCRALAAVHGAGLVHRDVKARNVMRAEYGRHVLMDFGAGVSGARVEAGGVPALTGTPLYLAPEVLAGAAATVASDIYAVGVLLYHLTTGSYPINAGSIEAIREAHRRGDRSNLHDSRPDLPDAFVRLVNRALAPDPQQRFATAGAMRSELKQVFSAAADPAPVAPGVEAPGRAPEGPGLLHRAGFSRVSRRVFAAAAAVALLVVAALVWTGTRPGSGRGAPATGAARLAVLPLRNLTGGPDWRVDAVTEDLMTTFGMIPGVQVAGWTSVQTVSRGSAVSAEEIASALNVTWLLEGSVRQAPDETDQMVVTLRLLHAGSAAPAWTTSVTKRASDLFAVARDAVDGVCERMGVAVNAEARTRALVPHSQNSEARDAYLQARFLMRNERYDNLLAAQSQFERAVQLDPGYGLAYAWLGKCYHEQEIEQVKPVNIARPLAVAALQRALELDDTLADAHTHMGDLQLNYDWNWQDAGRSYTRAIQLNPNSITARMQYSKYLAALGRVDEGIREARVAQDLDPVSPATGNLALLLYYGRQYGESIELYSRRLQMMPGLAQIHFSLGRAYAAQGEFDQAIAQLERTIELGGGAAKNPLDVVELARTYAQAGRSERARELIAPIESSPALMTPRVQAYVGFVYAALGDNDRAFELFQSALNGRFGVLLWAQVDPRLDNLRNDPRYEDMLRVMGLRR